MNAIGIPKIIHQIWSGIDEPLPDIFKMLGDTWKHDYPEWEYRVWDNRMMNDFVQEHYPQYWTAYQQFPYNIQRWDAIRYLLLDKIGGMYVDFDYESLSSIEPLIEGKTCCFSEEPATHGGGFELQMEHYFNNGMMLRLCVADYRAVEADAVICRSERSGKGGGLSDSERTGNAV